MTVPPQPDLLVRGEDPTPGPPSRRRRAAGALVGVAVVLASAAVLHDERQRTGGGGAAAGPDAGAVRLALRPGRVPTPRYGHLRPRLHVVVANEGPVPVQLLGGTLVPAAWEVEVLPRTVLRPGRLTVLRLSPPDACGGPVPRRLRLDARLASGRTATQELDLSGAHLADGGRLDVALALAARSCAGPASPDTPGPAAPGDPAGPDRAGP